VRQRGIWRGLRGRQQKEKSTTFFIRQKILLKRRQNVSFSASIATILVERVFDGLVMLLFVFIALPFAPGLPDWLRQTVILASVAFFGALVVFLVMAALPQTSRTIYHWVISRFMPINLQPKLLALAIVIASDIEATGFDLVPKGCDVPFAPAFESTHT